MNKIIFQIGLLIFTLSIMFFSRMDIAIEEILLRAFLVFFLLTFMLGLITILFMKSISKTSVEKSTDTPQQLDRKAKV
ncbi:MAG: hypothetical protein R6W90_01645 [Ignavibacteriaceae bacterium]